MSTPFPRTQTGEPTAGSPVLLLHRLALAGLAGLLLVLALASLAWPFSWDHGIFAWIGDTVVHGGMPYRDAWDTKGPLPYYVFAAVERVLGRGMWGIRLVDLLALALSAWAAGRIVSPLGGRGAAAYTALALSIQYLGSGYFDTAQSDGWTGMLLLIGLVPLVGEERQTSLPRAAISALVLGMCLLGKPLFGVFGAIPAAYVLLGPDLDGAAKRRGLLLVATAFALPAALTAAWFAVRGAWPSLVETYLWFNFEQSAAPVPGLDMSFRGALIRFGRRILSSPAVVLALAFAAVAVPTLWRGRRRAAILLVLATGIAFFTVFIQQRYWNRYQWHPPHLALAVLAGCGAGRLWRLRTTAWAGRVAPLLAGLGAAALLGSLLPPPLDEARAWTAWQLGRLSRDQYRTRFSFAALSWTIDDSEALAAYLRAHTRPGERVLVWSDPLVYYLSERPSTGALAWHGPVIRGLMTPLVERQRTRFMADLSRYAPRFIAVGRRDLEVADSLNESNIAGRFPALREVIATEYVPVARFGERELYRRRAPRSAASR